VKAIQPEKETPPIASRGHKTEKTGQNYAGLIQSATLPFRRDGFDHALIERTGLVYLVARSKNGRQMHYEVAVLKRHKARQWPDGRLTPDGWHYPLSECWGESGWTYTDLAQARCRYLSECRKGGLSVGGRVTIADNRENAPCGERRAA
jgi:hypothetical protein